VTDAKPGQRRAISGKASFLSKLGGPRPDLGAAGKVKEAGLNWSRPWRLNPNAVAGLGFHKPSLGALYTRCRLAQSAFATKPEAGELLQKALTPTDGIDK